MKTKMRDTSLEAYSEIKSELGKKQMEVLQVIHRLKKCSNRMIAQTLGWEINRVTGRVNELNAEGYIEAWEKVRDEDTGRNVWTWTVTEKGEHKAEGQLNMFQ